MKFILPISAFPDVVNAGVCLMGLLLIRSSRLAHPGSRPQQPVRWFEQTYGFLTLAYLFFAVPVFILSDHPTTLAIGYTLAHLFLFIALSSFVRIPASFYFPRHSRTIYLVYLFLGIAMTVWSLWHLPQPEILPLQGMVEWNQAPITAIPTAILFFSVLFPSLVFFGIQSFVVKDFAIRTRALLFSLGLLLLIGGAALFYLVDFSWRFMVVNFFAMLGYLVFLVGIIIGHHGDDEA